jgi:hypothetical protein
MDDEYNIKYDGKSQLFVTNKDPTNIEENKINKIIHFLSSKTLLEKSICKQRKITNNWIGRDKA